MCNAKVLTYSCGHVITNHNHCERSPTAQQLCTNWDLRVDTLEAVERCTFCRTGAPWPSITRTHTIENVFQVAPAHSPTLDPAAIWRSVLQAEPTIRASQGIHQRETAVWPPPNTPSHRGVRYRLDGTTVLAYSNEYYGEHRDSLQSELGEAAAATTKVAKPKRAAKEKVTVKGDSVKKPTKKAIAKKETSKKAATKKGSIKKALSKKDKPEHATTMHASSEQVDEAANERLALSPSPQEGQEAFDADG